MPASTTGRLAVVGTPAGATVQIDGPDGLTHTGVLPMSPLALAPGSYAVRVSFDGFEATTVSVHIDRDVTRTLPISLKKLGILTILGAPAGAQLEISGPEGQYNLVLPVERLALGPGAYQIRATADGYFEQQVEANIRTGRPASVSIQLKPRPGTLTIEGTPEDATIELLAGTRRIHKTSGLTQTIPDLPAGDYAMNVTREGYTPEHREVSIGPGSQVHLETRLRCAGSLQFAGSPKGARIDVVGSGITPPSRTLPGTFTELCPDRYSIHVNRRGFVPFDSSMLLTGPPLDPIHIKLRLRSSVLLGAASVVLGLAGIASAIPLEQMAEANHTAYQKTGSQPTRNQVDLSYNLVTGALIGGAALVTLGGIEFYVGYRP